MFADYAWLAQSLGKARISEAMVKQINWECVTLHPRAVKYHEHYMVDGIIKMHLYIYTLE